MTPSLSDSLMLVDMMYYKRSQLCTWPLIPRKYLRPAEIQPVAQPAAR